MKRANFFILGAPKCGTTSLASWLSAHPQVFMTKPKEPNYFSKDIPFSHRPRSLREYEQLFKAVESQHQAIGEASTAYLRSKEAVPAILRYNPSAKFIVCLRNPVEMVASVHMQLIKVGRETEMSLEQAWKLQETRRHSKEVSQVCLESNDLLYVNICSLGEQMERLFKLVSRERVLVILLDDMKIDPRREYRRALDFLGVGDDGRSHFPVENARQVPRYPRLAQTLRAVGLMKAWIGFRKPTGIGKMIQSLNNQKPKDNTISPEMQAILQEFFCGDIEKLSQLLGRDLSHWTSQYECSAYL
ncbi:sulfotransferase [Nitrosococcus halophilus Nc 4]|uniref:Sulfotransferase n=2 Tax=Nitrosococcus halophilus TaxID=133539 RepID=D5C0F0_NITHN|nr:sulfotransferase [Nitrosococcus halophilus Nc 4]